MNIIEAVKSKKLFKRKGDYDHRWKIIAKTGYLRFSEIGSKRAVMFTEENLLADDYEVKEG